MHVPINVKSSNNISKWQMGFNSAFKGLNELGFSMFQNVEFLLLIANRIQELSEGVAVRKLRYALYPLEVNIIFIVQF
jgi:hypothetical protein